MKKLDFDLIDISIPKNVENMQLPDPGLLTFYKNYESRILWLDDEITEYSIEFAKHIMQWNRDDLGVPIEERKPIVMVFFSPGGDLNVNNMLIDTIKLSKTPIVGINCGLCASAACFIFLSCHERYTFPNAEFLLHKGRASFSGNYDEVVYAILNYQREIDELEDFVMSVTNIPEDVFEENFSSDWYITAEEAIEYGMCSRAIESLDELFE